MNVLGCGVCIQPNWTTSSTPLALVLCWCSSVITQTRCGGCCEFLCVGAASLLVECCGLSPVLPPPDPGEQAVVGPNYSSMDAYDIGEDGLVPSE